jgi:transmembrane sensor
VDELVIRHLQGATSASEEAALRAWRAASPENERHFQELASVWAALADYEARTDAPPAAQLLAEAGTRRARPLRADWPRDSLSRRSLAVGAAVAATVLLALAAGRLVEQRPSGSPPLIEPVEFATGAGQTLMAQLSDGTIVHLAPESRLQVTPRADRREVTLYGRAFFGVISRPGTEFVVRGPYGAARVLGTRFEFSAEEGNARVVVLEGRVAFEAGGGEVQIEAGQMSAAAGNRPPSVTSMQQPDSLLAWMGRSLVFRETPLGQAAREIEARYGARVEIADTALAGETISGGFDNRNLTEILQAICQILDADCTIDSSSAVIRRRPLP